MCNAKVTSAEVSDQNIRRITEQQENRSNHIPNLGKEIFIMAHSKLSLFVQIVEGYVY